MQTVLSVKPLFLVLCLWASERLFAPSRYGSCCGSVHLGCMVSGGHYTTVIVTVGVSVKDVALWQIFHLPLECQGGIMHQNQVCIKHSQFPWIRGSCWAHYGENQTSILTMHSARLQRPGLHFKN